MASFLQVWGKQLEELEFAVNESPFDLRPQAGAVSVMVTALRIRAPYLNNLPACLPFQPEDTHDMSQAHLLQSILLGFLHERKDWPERSKPSLKPPEL
jgi:hypothetical protein